MALLLSYPLLEYGLDSSANTQADFTINCIIEISKIEK